MVVNRWSNHRVPPFECNIGYGGGTTEADLHGAMHDDRLWLPEDTAGLRLAGLAQG